MTNKRTAIILGAGHRAMYYASYAREHPEALEIVGVADLSEQRRAQAAQAFQIRPEMCFQSAEQLAARPRLADFIINGTMDHQHVPTSLPLLRCGYDLLLEKPFAVNEAEMWQLVETAQAHHCKVAVCHVLRYAPFYAAIRQKVVEGAIGELLSVQAVEHVSYHHMAVAFVRGKWSRRAASGSGMLMAKSCHDLDLIVWMKSGTRPRRVASFGSNFQFPPEKAPERAGTRCLVDCPIERDCLYSARKHYLDNPDRWTFYVWDALEGIENPSLEARIESLKSGPYGRCVWKAGMDVVDHQSVVVEFTDGCTATLNMIGGSAKPSRSIHLVGTRGEIQGNLEEGRFAIRWIDPRPAHEYQEQIVDLNVTGDMSGAQGGHAGGDLRLVADFVRELNGQARSLSSTNLEDSILGHLLGFCAERARETGQVVEIPARGAEGRPAKSLLCKVSP